MKNLKERNIQKTIWHIKRNCNQLSETSDMVELKSKLFYLQSSIDCLNRILNDQDPYPEIDSREFLAEGLIFYFRLSAAY